MPVYLLLEISKLWFAPFRIRPVTSGSDDRYFSGSFNFRFFFILRYPSCLCDRLLLADKTLVDAHGLKVASKKVFPGWLSRLVASYVIEHRSKINACLSTPTPYPPPPPMNLNENETSISIYDLGHHRSGSQVYSTHRGELEFGLSFVLDLISHRSHPLHHPHLLLDFGPGPAAYAIPSSFQRSFCAKLQPSSILPVVKEF